MIYFDSLNTILMFVSVFYYSAYANQSLQTITTFLVRIAGKILSQIFLIAYLILVFAVAIFYFFQQTIEELNDFASALVSSISISLGNSVLEEREILINDMGEQIYNFVRLFEVG